MSAKTFTAIDAAGGVHRQTSAWVTFTHTVVFLPSYDEDMAFADRDFEGDGLAWDTAGGVIQSYNDAARPIDEADRYAVAEFQKAQEIRNEFPSRESAIAGKRAVRARRVEAARSAGYYATWQNAGWFTREDLAQLMASKITSSAVAVLEAAEADDRQKT